MRSHAVLKDLAQLIKTQFRDCLAEGKLAVKKIPSPTKSFTKEKYARLIIFNMLHDAVAVRTELSNTCYSFAEDLEGLAEMRDDPPFISLLA